MAYLARSSDKENTMENPILAAADGAKQEESDVSADELKVIEETMRANTITTNANIKALQDATVVTSDAAKLLETSLKVAGESRETVSAVTENANLEAQNATIAAFENTGGDANQTALIKELRVDENRTADAMDRKVDIVDDEITGFSFLDAIINEFRVLQVDAEIDANVDKQSQTARQLANVGVVTSTVAQTEALTKKTINQSTIQANLNLIQAETAGKVSEATIANAASNADSVARVQRMQSQQLEAQVALRQLRNADATARRAEQRLEHDKKVEARQAAAFVAAQDQAAVNLSTSKLNLENLTALSPTERAAAIARNEETVRQLTESTELRTQVTSSIKAGLSASGLPAEDDELILAGYSSNDRATRERYSRLLSVGNSPEKILGATPYEARETLNTLSPTGNYKETKNTKLLEKIEVQAEATYETGSVIRPATNDTVELAANYNKAAQQIAGVASKEIAAGDNANPYAAPPMSTLATFESVKKSALYRNVLQDMNFPEADPQSIIDAAMNGISAKVLTPEQAAAGIVDLYSSAAEWNNTIEGGYARIGFPEQVTYNARVRRTDTNFEIITTVMLNQPSSIAIAAKLALTAKEGIKNEADRAERSGQRTAVVNLMDRTAVQELVIKLMSSKAPAPKAIEE